MHSAECPNGKNQPFELVLNDAELDAFQELRGRLISPPILAPPCYGQQYTLDMDECDHQIGCALLQQKPNGDVLSVGYWSKRLSASEKNHSTTENERLAEVWRIFTLQPYLYGDTFTLRTDRHTLK